MPGNSGQGGQSSDESLADTIDYNDLGIYSPEDDIEERLLESALNSLEQAIELNQQYIERVRNPYDETKEMIEQYKEFYEETGHALDPELFTDLWSTGESPEFLKTTRDSYLELAQSGLESYAEMKEEQAEFKRMYLNMFGTEGLDIDPDEGPVLQQVEVQDIVDHFLNNQVNKN